MGVNVNPVDSVTGVALNTLLLWYKSEWVCAWATLSSNATVILVPWQGEGVVLTPWWPKSSERCCDPPVNSPASDLLDWVDMPYAKCDVVTETWSGTKRVTFFGSVWLTPHPLTKKKSLNKVTTSHSRAKYNSCTPCAARYPSFVVFKGCATGRTNLRNIHSGWIVWQKSRILRR